MAEVPATDIVVGQTYRVLKYKPPNEWRYTYIGKCNKKNATGLMEFDNIQHVQGERIFDNNYNRTETNTLPNPKQFYSRFFTLPTAKEISAQVNQRTNRIEQRNVQDAIMAKTGLDFVSVYGMTKGMLGKSSKTHFNPSRRLPTKAPSSRERDPHPSPASSSKTKKSSRLKSSSSSSRKAKKSSRLKGSSSSSDKSSPMQTIHRRRRNRSIRRRNISSRTIFRGKPIR
jgi:hypothetical protein